MAAQPNQPNPLQVASAQANTQMFYSGRSSIHGIGSFARVGILRGRLIHSESPFLYLCSDEYPVSPQDPQDPRWQTWLDLRPPGTPLPEIFRSTSIRCGVMRRGNQQVEISGVFLQAVRFNSSCQPNVHAHWNETGRCMEFRALKDIAVDEELCHCYDPPTLLYSTAERQHRLFNQWRTDLRRKMEAGVPATPSSVQELRDSIREKTSAIVDLRRAGLHHYAETLHYDLYKALMQISPPNNAMLCLLTARNLTRVMVGNNDPRIGQMTAVLPPNLQNNDSLVCEAGCCYTNRYALG